MRESRIVLPPNAGVAELADALDSKSTATLGNNQPVAILLPNFDGPPPLRQTALESFLIAGRLMIRP